MKNITIILFIVAAFLFALTATAVLTEDEKVSEETPFCPACERLVEELRNQE